MSILQGATRKFVSEAFGTETDACIVWPFSLHISGYPQAQDGAGAYKPHRRICEMLHGPAPSRKHHAAHSCHNRACINKRHLRWATPKENMADNVRDGNRRAFRVGRQTLTVEQAREVRAAHAQGETFKSIGGRYSLSGVAIRKIVNGITYANA